MRHSHLKHSALSDVLPHAFLDARSFRAEPCGVLLKVDAQIQLSTNKEAFASGRVPHSPNLAIWAEFFETAIRESVVHTWWS